MSFEENQLVRVPERVAYRAAVEATFCSLPRNTFVVADQAPRIADALGIPLRTVVDILQTPNPSLYPDVPQGLERIAQAGSLPIVWTQGDLDIGTDLTTISEETPLSFQPLKIVRSGLHTHLLPFVEKLSPLGIPSLLGGSDKCDPTVILPVLNSAQRHGLRHVVAVDDLGQNLVQLGELCNMIGMPYTPVLIGRGKNRQTGMIGSFDELSIISEALYMLDLDRTQIDTDSMKQDLYLRLTQCMESLVYSERR